MEQKVKTLSNKIYKVDGINNIRIYQECEGRIEKSVPRITV